MGRLLLFLLLTFITKFTFCQNRCIEISIPTCEDECKYIWNNIIDIPFFDSNGYSISLPNTSLISQFVERSRNKSLSGFDESVLYENIKDSVFDIRDYLNGYAKIVDGLPIIENAISQIASEPWYWHFQRFPKYSIKLTLYGPGGSYNPEKGEIILLTDTTGNFKGNKSPVNTIIHEIIHIGIESSIINKYDLSHCIKERIVDRFIQVYFDENLLDYEVQDFGNEEAVLIDKYLNEKSDFINLSTRIEQFLAENHIAYRIPEKDLIPEGITYSSLTNSFYVSSIYKAKIIQLDAKTGTYKDFTPFDIFEMRYLGMAIDETRNLLWACGNMTKNKVSYSTVTKFDLITGHLLNSLSYEDTVANTYNDIVLDKDGNSYFTDSHGKCVYKIDAESESIDMFYEGEEITHPNGITISPDNKYLYIASTDQGIRVLDIQKREIIGRADSTFNSTGIDGLKYYKKSLIGIQNAVDERNQVKIARYFLDETKTRIIKMEIIDQNNPLFDIPTTFVIVDDDLYCLANSQLKNLSSPDFRIIHPEELNDVMILKYGLK